jgi:hypothetical protein
MAKVSKKEHKKLIKKFKDLKRDYKSYRKSSNMSDQQLLLEQAFESVRAHNLLEIQHHHYTVGHTVSQDMLELMRLDLKTSRARILSMFDWKPDTENEEISLILVNSEELDTKNLLQFSLLYDSSMSDDDEEDEEDETEYALPMECWFKSKDEGWAKMTYEKVPNDQVLSLLGLEKTAAKLEE